MTGIIKTRHVYKVERAQKYHNCFELDSSSLRPLFTQFTKIDKNKNPLDAKQLSICMRQKAYNNCNKCGFTTGLKNTHYPEERCKLPEGTTSVINYTTPNYQHLDRFISKISSDLIKTKKDRTIFSTPTPLYTKHGHSASRNKNKQK